MHYAVSDVTHLRDVFAALDADLKKRRRSEWVSIEMEVLTSPKTYDFHPERAWERLKTRVRKPKDLAVLMEVAAWREQEAQSRDVPRGRVLRDEAVSDIATHAPNTIEKLANLRSVPKGFEKSKWGADIVAAVERGLARDPATLPKLEKPRNNNNGAAIVELLKVLLRMTAERHAVASKVIATVDDLEEIAADDEADVPALARLAPRAVRRGRTETEARRAGAGGRERPRDRGSAGGKPRSNNQPSSWARAVRCEASRGEPRRMSGPAAQPGRRPSRPAEEASHSRTTVGLHRLARMTRRRPLRRRQLRHFRLHVVQHA